MNNFCIIIPATKKNVAFTDDLVKKLAGRTLIQRAIDKAKKLTGPQHIYIVTDSDEIRLICERNGTRVFYDKDLKLEPKNVFESIKFFVLRLVVSYRDIILLSPYAPLLKAESVQLAYDSYLEKGNLLLVSVKRRMGRLFVKEQRGVGEIVLGEKENELYFESVAFQIIKSSLIIDSSLVDVKPAPYLIDNDVVEICSYQDWWVCEKLLGRKRIIFRIIGNVQVGMGHIYRALTLAHEITDHEIRFVCDEASKVAVSKMAGYDYWLGIYDQDEMTERIIELQPDLVVNDILDTSAEYVKRLKEKNIKVMNFEDLGSGVSLANLAINELYDEPLIEGDNILWGYNYFFLRDEFHGAVVHTFTPSVDSLLITFGGTDQNDFSRKIFHAVLPFCKKNRIKIYIVTGEGYANKELLNKDIKRSGYDEVVFTHATGVISGIMEKSQVAISSNGRTLYELAHMNIPAIVLSHHAREKTHLFASESNGFINAGFYNGQETEDKILVALKCLVENHQYRATLYNNLTAFDFTENKKKVVQRILELLEG